MKMIKMACMGLAAAVVSMVVTGSAAGSVLATPPVAHPVQAAAWALSTVDASGTWTERVDRNRPGITSYVQSLELSKEGTFQWVNGFQCNAAICPQFKIGVNQGTYLVDGDTLHFKGNLFNAIGKITGADAIEVDGHSLVRVNG